MLTPRLLNQIREKQRVEAIRNNGRVAAKAMQRQTAALNGQVMTYRNDGRRTARAFSDVGMASHAHVCRNIKSAKVKRYVAPRWKPTPARAATGLTPYFTAKGVLKYRKREIGTGAYDPRAMDPRVRAEVMGERREADTGVVVERMIRLGGSGRLVAVPIRP